MIIVQVLITLGLFLAVDLFFADKVFNKKVLLAFMVQIVVIWGFFLHKFRLGIIFRVKPFLSRFRGYLVTVCFGCTVLFMEIELMEFIRKTPHSLSYLALFAALNLIVLILFKMAFYSFMRFIRSNGHNSRNVILVADTTTSPFIDYFTQSKDWGYRIMGIVSPREDLTAIYPGTRVVPCHTELRELIDRNPVDDIFYCLPIEDKCYDLEQLIAHSEETGFSLHIMQQPFIHYVMDSSMGIKAMDNSFTTYSKLPPHYVGLKVKDMMDLALSVVALVCCLPLMALLTLLIKLGDGGPVFFRQERIGLNGRRFNVYKFRTMVTNAEELKDTLTEQNEADGPVFKIDNDPRVTRIGRFLRKTSLDELPQFYNVIKGDMSIVGPRPPLLKEVQQYERLQLRRLSMKPGITCTWQVWGRHEVSFSEWMRMDLEYIDNWSPLLDIRICLATVGVVLKANGR